MKRTKVDNRNEMSRPACLSRGARVPAAALFMSLLPVAAGQAQTCIPEWLQLSNGTNGFFVTATTLWDPDGAGPLEPRIVAGGNFTTAGGVTANRIAMWDAAAQQWTALGTGLNGNVSALMAHPDGSLIVGGNFSTAGGVTVRCIARWDGTVWSALGAGMTVPSPTTASVNALALLASGDLVAGGSFTTAGGVAANYVARWNGTSWSAMGSGLNNTVRALTRLQNGDLVAGGSFTLTGGAYIARWNGTSWALFGGGTTGGSPAALLTLSNGDLIAGGGFETAGGIPANRIARWNGTTWSALGLGMSGGAVPGVSALAVTPTGDLIAGGGFTTAGSSTVNYVARWNGSAWSPIGTGTDNSVGALTATPGGDIVVGGFFTLAGGLTSNHVAIFGCPGGACCLTDSTCQMLMPSACSAAGGVFRGYNTTCGAACPVTGGCCLSDGSCQMLAAAACAAAGGVYHGNDVSCSVAFCGGACCLPNGSCTLLWGPACAALNGRYRGDGVACASTNCECYPNCDNSTLSPYLNINDFVCFTQRFLAGDPWANCDHSTTAPVFNVNDFQCFFNSFAVGGCP